MVAACGSATKSLRSRKVTGDLRERLVLKDDLKSRGGTTGLPFRHPPGVVALEEHPRCG